MIYSCFCYISEISCFIFSLVLESHNQVNCLCKWVIVCTFVACSNVLWSVGEKSWHDCNTDLLSIFWHEKYALTLRQLIRLEVLPSYNFTLFSPRPLRDLCCSTFPSYFFFQFIFYFIHFYVSLDFHSSDKVVWI